jgi:glutamate synthase domain-containing protein 2
MSNITELRSIMFDTLNKLKSGDIEVDRAREINNLSQTIINSAKVEIDFMRVSGHDGGTGFISGAPITTIKQPPKVPGLADQVQGANVRTHRLAG